MQESEEISTKKEMAEEVYIGVIEAEGEEAVEVPLEEDGTLSLATLQGQFPGAAGLKYRSPDTGAWRALRIADGSISQTNNEWTGNTYCVVYPKDNKRKGEEGDETETDGPQTKRQVKPPKVITTKDMLIRNLPFSLEEEQLRAYFETFGELVMVQLKKDLEGKSRGFAFIRYKELADQGKVLGEHHWIEGRQCEVKISQSPVFDEVVVPGQAQPHLSRRVFVGRVTEDVTKEDLETYFTKYGEVSDVFVPNPHRMFAFVTFTDAESARSLIDLDEDHLIKGCSISVAYASVKKPTDKRRNAPAGMPDNPMEVMGMAMSMMQNWAGDQGGQQRGGKRGGKPGGQQQGGGGYGGYGGGYGQGRYGGFGGGYGGGGAW